MTLAKNYVSFNTSTIRQQEDMFYKSGYPSAIVPSTRKSVVSHKNSRVGPSGHSSLPRLNTEDIPPAYCSKPGGPRFKNYLSSVDVEKSNTYENHKTNRTSFSIDEKVEMLQFAFPDIDATVIHDVLAAKLFDLAETSEVLCTFMSEMEDIESDYQLVPTNFEDEEYDPSDSTSEWVVLPEAWEDCSDDLSRSYREAVIRTTPTVASVAINRSSQNPPIRKELSTVSNKRESEVSNGWDWGIQEFWNLKSFGERRNKSKSKNKGYRK